MDVCWIMSEPNRNLADELPGVIAALEDKTSILCSEGLYKNLLPTLGSRIIGPMVERVRITRAEHEAAGDSGPFSRFLSEAVVKLKLKMREEDFAGADFDRLRRELDYCFYLGIDTELERADRETAMEFSDLSNKAVFTQFVGERYEGDNKARVTEAGLEMIEALAGGE